MTAERLQKLIARAGIASRRSAEELILEGRVTVNGAKVTELGSKADLAHDHVKVDGKLLRAPARHHTYVVNKPRGVVVTKDDPQGRQTVFTLIGPRLPAGVVPVGRLDADSEGLLVLSDDGELVHKLTHPSGGCRKEYEVKVSGVPTPEQIARLSRGIVLDGVRTAPAEISLEKTTPERQGAGGNAWMKVVLREGRSRQIRRMFESVGHPVSKLRRVAIGPLRDPAMPPGTFRELSAEEVAALYAIEPAARTGAPARRRPSAGRPPRRSGPPAPTSRAPSKRPPARSR
ncbi:MAG TPA: pseudouridine synthase [Thermoanaerobaculia bacterium]|nr:pseudouridine synthase [Thermoanaerobaculia bacterium]